MPKHPSISALLGAAFLLLAAGGPAHGQSCEPEQIPTPGVGGVTIKAVGDIVLGSDWPESHYPPDFEGRALELMRASLGQADVVFGNFEGALTTHNVSRKNPNYGTVFAFRMPPRFAGLLRDAGFSVLHVANNHTFDFERTGFDDTLAYLAEAGIVAVGEPDRVIFQEMRDITLAWVGFSHLFRDNHVLDYEKLEALVLEARLGADIVIVSMQAGAEGSDHLRVRDHEELFLGENRGNTFEFAHKAIDFGADLVLGHGPHVLRGMECYKGKLIAYSLGNFVGYNALSVKRAAAITAVLAVQLSPHGQTLGFEIAPMRFNDERFPEPDPDERARHLINDLSRLAPLNGTVRLPVAETTGRRYREWLRAAELTPLLTDR